MSNFKDFKFQIKEVVSSYDSNVTVLNCYCFGKNGDLIGKVETDIVGGQLEPQNVYVDLEFRRQGIATQMYNLLEQSWGRPLLPSQSQTTEGKLFWKSRKK